VHQLNLLVRNLVPERDSAGAGACRRRRRGRDTEGPGPWIGSSIITRPCTQPQTEYICIANIHSSSSSWGAWGLHTRYFLPAGWRGTAFDSPGPREEAICKGSCAHPRHNVINDRPSRSLASGINGTLKTFEVNGSRYIYIYIVPIYYIYGARAPSLPWHREL
jgi:hypothetical protein